MCNIVCKIESFTNIKMNLQFCDCRTLNILNFHSELSKSQPQNDQQERIVENTLKETYLMLNNLLDLQDLTPSTALRDSSSSPALTSDELREELQKVLDSISKVYQLRNSTNIDEAKLAKFREFEEREVQRFNKVLRYIKVMEQVKL